MSQILSQTNSYSQFVRFYFYYHQIVSYDFALIIDSSISRLLGEEWSVKPEVQEQLEQFTCIMYGHARETSVNSVRTKMLRKMVGEDKKLTKSKVDLSRIPPCSDSLLPHIQRVNYRYTGGGCRVCLNRPLLGW